MPADIRLTLPQVSVRLLPFLVVAWTRASLALVIPGFIATFDLSIAEAGRVVMDIEIGSFATMIGLAFAMDRLGAGRVLAWGLPTLALAPKDALYEKMVNNIKEVKARDGVVLAVATEGDIDLADEVDEVIYIPEAPALLIPILSTVPLQLLAYHIAVQRGCDVDQPRNLAKSVTVE